MKREKKLTGIAAFLAAVGLVFASCGDGGGGGGGCNAECLAVGATGPGGGTIIYHKHSGFTVTGEGSFTAYYLEAAPTNQATDVEWSNVDRDVTGATGTAIGTGKANTAAILAAHPSDKVSNNSAVAAAAYSGGGKSDWFLPSKDELNEIFKARTHLNISGWFRSSSQYDISKAWGQAFNSVGTQRECSKYLKDSNVRAVRAF